MTTQNTINGKLMNLMLGMIAIAVFGIVSAQPAQAQLGLPSLPTPPPTNLSYSFSVPVAKVVPNPCTNGFVLVSGNAGFTIQSTDSGSSGFSLKIDSNTSGKGEDALSDGTLVLLSGKTPYDYSSTTTSDATFPRKPGTVLQTLTVGEYLVRSVEGTTSDAFIMKTVFEINYVNGVPALPILRSIDTRCASEN